ncbi:hypothetical protein BH93_02495 [Rhodococcoides fascians A25f]|uniref:hypothetical protein n=1 Tax=Rhodococcoides fascians TaxID=1828 RepID=UPI0005663BFF|nr:hypothetical protein [Rhodococcus fascians]QII04384.1 hypothetical protein BH93_02495 [Rhodococcus fascians A25f]
MEMAQVDDLAGMMLDSYDETAVAARNFATEHDWPMTVLAKAQLFRSIVQGRVMKDDRFVLGNAYVSMGRVLVTDTTLNTDLLIRSEKALRIEQEHLDPTLDLDVRRVLSGVKLLVYRFSKTGLTLSWCESYAKKGSRRLFPDGAPEAIGYWPSAAASTLNEGEFDQGSETNWDEVGDVGDEAGSDE